MNDVGYESFVADCRDLKFGAWKTSRIVSRNQGRPWSQFSLTDPQFPLSSPVPIDFEYPYRPPTGSRIHRLNRFKPQPRTECETVANVILFSPTLPLPEPPIPRPSTAPVGRRRIQPNESEVTRTHASGRRSAFVPKSPKSRSNPRPFRDCLTSLDELREGTTEEAEAIVVQMSLKKRQDASSQVSIK
jgi:hypothetical protein